MFTSFLYPAFLVAGLAAAVPLILHMIQRLRVVRIPFSTIRFLSMAVKKTARRTRVENLLLLSLRMLVILLISTAFAMPMVRTGAMASFLRESDRDVALVIDGSYSMQYRAGTATAWDRALETAGVILDGLRAGDRVCVFVARDVPQPVIEQLTTDKTFALDQLKAVEPNGVDARLSTAVAAAWAVLDRESGNRDRELHVITDGQELAWSAFDKTAVRPEAVGETGIFVTLTGVPAPENTAVKDVRLTPSLSMAGMSTRLAVDLVRSGVPVDSPVSVYIDGAEVARRGLMPEASDDADARFTIPPLAPGIHVGRIELPPDSLPVDNTFLFLVRTHDSLPSLCVGSAADTFFLMKALNPLGPGGPGGSGMSLRRVDRAAVGAEDLARYSCVFLCNALPMPGEAIVNLERYVEAGGLLVIFPGDGASVTDYRAWRCLPGCPVAAEDLPTTARKCVLRWDQSQHPIVDTLKPQPGETPVINIMRRLRWKERGEDGAVIITAGAGAPFLLQHAFGNGRVLMFAVAADRSWSDLPLSPYFLPIVHQTVRYGTGLGGSVPYIWGTRNLPLAIHLPAAVKQSSLVNPAGVGVTIRTATVDGRTVLHAENVLMPGIYSFRQSTSAMPEPALAVNLDRRESNLAVIDPNTIPAVMGCDGARVARDGAELAEFLAGHRVGRTFGEQILWMAFIVAVVEVVYANRKSRNPGK